MLADGNVVAGAAAQPRRLAVLALLARAGRAGVTREKILALLWPDEPEDRARRSLNQAVYSLRRDLGSDDALLGAKDLRLNVDLIDVDVMEFEDAIRSGDSDRAVALYGGPFLDGFYLPRSSEFERWVEAERLALAHEYTAALERVANLAAQRGDHTAAVAHWRRLAGADPLNARVALSLMTSLTAVGDPGGAIQHARLHEALLDQELGLPPDKDVAAFARQLRARPEPSAVPDTPPPLAPTPAPTAAPVRDEPTRAIDPLPVPRARSNRLRGIAIGVTVVAICAVVFTAVAISRARTGNGAAPIEPVVAVGTINDYASRDSSGIARALRDMLATNLARSPELTVVSASRLLEVERQLSGGGPTAAGAIVPVARQAGATTLIDGAIYRLGEDTLRLDLRVTRLSDGNVLQAYTVTGHDAFALADSATAHLVQYLGSTAPRGSVADATTRSVTAYRLYEEGLRSYYLGDVASSGRLFEAALGEDSTFAMAAYYAALASTTTRAEYLRRMRRAVALAVRASDRERLIIEGGWAAANNSLALRAIAETLTTRYPTETEGHYYLGRALVNAGLFLDAIAPLRRVELMDSLSLRGGSARCAACDALHQQVSAFMLADSMPAAERVARRWVSARPKEWVPHNVLGGILTAMNRIDEASVELRTADSLDALGSLWEPMATLWTRQGEFTRADELLRSEIAKGGDATNAHWFLAISLRYQGRLADALGEARAFRRGARLDRVPPGAADPASLQEAQVLRELGRFREAAALFDSVSRFSVIGADSTAVESSRAWSLAHEAGALAAAGDTSRLAALADTIELVGAKSNLGRDNRLHHHVRGLLLAARGDDSTAVTEFRHAIYSFPFGYTRTNVELGKALIRLGRYADAVAVLEPALRGSLEAANLYATHPEIRLLIAEAYAGAGQRDRANGELDWVRRAWEHADASVRPQLAAAVRAVARFRK